jgi:hypothetical protein
MPGEQAMKKAWTRFLRWLEAAGWHADLGKEAAMAKLIEFYVPATFKPPKTRWTPAELRGKVINFHVVARKSA